MGLSEALFNIFAGTALATALAVVFTRNTVYAALFFVAHLLSLAVIYSLLHAPLLGVLQVMVYAGAVMVLFLFAVMILDMGEQEHLPLADNWTQIAGAGLLAAAFLAVIHRYAHNVLLTSALAPAGDPAKPALDVDNIASIARVLFRDYALSFEAVGLLLLVAVVAVMVMAKRKLES